jgi:hypothetical protein
VRKGLIGALVGALVLAVAGAALATAEFKQTASIKYTKKDVRKSTGFKAKLTAVDPAAQYQKPEKAASKVVVAFPGAKVDTEGAAVCDKTDQEIQNGDCPSDSLIGSGEAKANAQPLISNCTPTESIRAYNTGDGIAFALRQKGDCPGQPLVLRGKWSGSGVKEARNGVISATNPTLTTTVPPLVVLGTKVVLTSFELKTKAKSDGRHKLVRTPGSCTGYFRIKTKITYDDGSTYKKTTKTRCNEPD